PLAATRVFSNVPVAARTKGGRMAPASTAAPLAISSDLRLGPLGQNMHSLLQDPRPSAASPIGRAAGAVTRQALRVRRVQARLLKAHRVIVMIGGKTAVDAGREPTECPRR